MNLKQFASMAGVCIVPCSKVQWGGSFGYKTADTPNCTICGFKTEEQVYKSWLTDTFGKTTARSIMTLLRDSESTK